MTMAEYKELFEVQFMPDTNREIMRDRFRDFRQRHMSVMDYTRCFNMLAMFASKDVAIDLLCVGRFRHGLYDEYREVRLICRLARPITYKELRNLAL